MNGIISDNSIVNLGNLQQYIWLEFRIVNILVIFSKIPSSHHQDTYRVKSREPVGSKNSMHYIFIRKCFFSKWQQHIIFESKGLLWSQEAIMA